MRKITRIHVKKLLIISKRPNDIFETLALKVKVRLINSEHAMSTKKMFNA